MALPDSVREYLDASGLAYHVDDDEPPEALIVTVPSFSDATKLETFLDTLRHVACTRGLHGEFVIHDQRDIPSP